MSSRKTALAIRPASYAVGYGKPPTHSRFKPGQSGNPKGRPKGSRNRPAAPPVHQDNRLQAIILEEAYRGVPVNDGKRQVTIPMAQAVVRSVAVNAAKGSQRAQRLFTTLVTATERDRRALLNSELEAAVTYKVQWERELERRQRLGIVAADPLPHPDHIVIDLSDGTVPIKGPATKEEKAFWDVLTEHRTNFESELCELKAYVEDPEATELEEAMVEIDKLTHCLELIRVALDGSRTALRILKDALDQVVRDNPDP